MLLQAEQKLTARYQATIDAVAESADEDDSSSPYNWPSWRKVTIGVICSTSQLITTMSASMIAPALGDMNRDLGIDATTGQIMLAIFFLGIGLAPMLIAPMSEIFGRRPVWLLGNGWFILWNSLCPVGSSPGMMLVGRLLSSCGASVGVMVSLPRIISYRPFCQMPPSHIVR